MLDLFWQRLDSGARRSLPLATTVICTLLSVVTWPLPHLGAVAPPLGLIAFYYWTVHRPDLFRPGMAFLIGILNDAINLPPEVFGLSALIYVAVHQLLLRQRRFFTGHSFFMTWTGFILMLLIIMLTEWIMLCLIRWQFLPFFPVLMQCVLAIAFFPLPCWLFIHLQRLTLSQN